jgi:nitrogen fixation protein NifQ
MTPDALYTLLINANEVTTCDPFDGHVLACIFATAVNEHLAGGSFTNALGIFGSALRRDIERYFPGALQRIEMYELDIEPTVTEDDKCLRELLWRFRSASSPISSLLTFLVARRATRPNHLWQDLGLANRDELSKLMLRHFTALARRNNQDMKWKKFLYRTICREDGFSMCVAPCCSECGDFDACFGSESGESLLTPLRIPDESSRLVSVASSFAQ